jgi:hypothetical protein
MFVVRCTIINILFFHFSSLFHPYILLLLFFGLFAGILPFRLAIKIKMTLKVFKGRSVSG